MTPQDQAAFLEWLDREIRDAERADRKMLDDIREEGRRSGYLDALRDVRAYFTDEQST